jgi:hypothetical protein
VLVKKHKGKKMRMPYDKRIIVSPCDLQPKLIDTIPFGHISQAEVMEHNDRLKTALTNIDLVCSVYMPACSVTITQRLLSYLL